MEEGFRPPSSAPVVPQGRPNSTGRSGECPVVRSPRGAADSRAELDPSPQRVRNRNMGKRIYCGNLSFQSSEDDVRALFSPHGEVTDVHIVMDRETGRSRGFAFVEMATEDQAKAAIKAL